MADTSLDERLSFAVITDPAGNLEFLRKAVLELPYREFARSKGSKKKPRIQDLEAIFVIGQLVDPLFRPEEARNVLLAREYLQDELDHNRDGYRQLNITDIPGLAHHLKHNAPFKRWHEQDKLIPTIERFIGLKKDGAWLNFGEAEGRIREQYRQMKDIAEKSKFPVYYAADTIFFEKEIPEERWLHWKSMLLGKPQQQLIKSVGMVGIDFAIPEFLAEPTMRGKSRLALGEFEPLQGKVTITYGMPDELLRQLKESKQRIVIAGKQGLFDKEANPAEHYPGNLLFLERPLSMSFYSFGSEAGVRVVYFLHNNKLMFFPESQINLREMSASAGKPPKDSDAEAAAQMHDMAAEIARILPLLEKQNPGLANKIRSAGFDRAQQLAHLIDSLYNQFDSITKEKMQFVSFLDDIIRHAGLFEWYQNEKKTISDELGVFNLGINTAKEALELRREQTEKAHQRSIDSIEELVHYLGLTDWYNTQKAHLNQPNGRTEESPASPARVMELYSLAITAIKEELDRRRKADEKLVTDANSQRIQYERDKGALESQLAERDRTINEQATKLAESEKAKKGFEYTLGERDKTITLQTARLNELIDEYARLESGMNGQVEENKKLQEKNAELEAAQNNYKALQAQLASLENLARQLKAEHPDIQEEDINGIISACISGAKGTVEKTKKDLKELQKTLRDYERALHVPESDKHVQKISDEIRADFQKRYNETLKEITAKAQKFRDDMMKKQEAAKAEFESKLAEKDKTIAGLEDILTTYRREVAESAYKLVEQGNYAKGIKEYTHAITTAPDDDPLLPKMLVNRGRAHIKVGDYQRALADFEKARQISPTYKNISQLITTTKEYQLRIELSKGQENGKKAKTVSP